MYFLQFCDKQTNFAQNRRNFVGACVPSSLVLHLSIVGNECEILGTIFQEILLHLTLAGSYFFLSLPWHCILIRSYCNCHSVLFKHSMLDYAFLILHKSVLEWIWCHYPGIRGGSNPFTIVAGNTPCPPLFIDVKKKQAKQNISTIVPFFFQS